MDKVELNLRWYGLAHDFYRSGDIGRFMIVGILSTRSAVILNLVNKCE